MDDLRIGAVCRALRRRQGWRQSDLATRAGVHQTTISRIERGAAGTLTVDVLRRVFAELGARFDPGVLWRGGELDRLLDARHATLVDQAAQAYAAVGWTVVPEVTFSEYGERGSIDLFCGYPRLRAVSVNEMKSDVTSVEETTRKHDMKVRLAPKLAQERFGWRPQSIGRVLVVPEDRTIRRIVDRHKAVFDAAYPARTREVGNWIREPSGNLAGLWFLPSKLEARASRSAGGSRRVRRPRPSGRASAGKRQAHE